MSTFDPGAFDALWTVDGSQTGSCTVSAVLVATQTASLTVAATLGITPVLGLPVNAVVFGERVGAASVDAVFISPAFAPSSLSVDAFLSGRFSVSALVYRDDIWMFPPDGAGIGQVETFIFVMLPPASGSMHFEIDFDKVATFDSPDLIVVKSHLDQTGWGYWDGAWQPVPQSGVPEAHSGSLARYTASLPSPGTWFRRVRTGVI